MNALHLPLLVITGSAPCLQEDLAIWQRLGDMMRHRVPENMGTPCCKVSPYSPYSADWMAVGLDAVDKYPWPIKYVVTYHPDEIPQFKPKREKVGGNTDYLVISHIDKTDKGEVIAGVDMVEPYKAPTGSSSLCGAIAGIRMGYERIVLCGCPLDVKPYLVFQEGWKAKKDEVIGRVRSMSGWTREFLGAPTEEWLRG